MTDAARPKRRRLTRAADTRPSVLRVVEGETATGRHVWKLVREYAKGRPKVRVLNSCHTIAEAERLLAWYADRDPATRDDTRQSTPEDSPCAI